MLDLTNQQFGRLTALEYIGKGRWRCQCECGQATIAVTGMLRNGHVKSCGCLRRDTSAQVNLKHGLSVSAEYQAYRHMMNRCYNPKDAAFSKYGGRGILVCLPRFGSFADFFADMGPRPSKHHSIERIDNDGPYAKWNCKWATRTEQCNNRRTSRRVTFQGETLTTAQWDRKLNYQSDTIGQRLRHGWSIEDAILIPVRRFNQNTFEQFVASWRYALQMGMI